MRVLNFDTEKEFLKKLDGKVYGICNCTGEIICDILEEDFIKLVDDGTIIDRTGTIDPSFYSQYTSDYILANVSDKSHETNFIEKYGVMIKIKEDSSLWQKSNR